MVPTPADPRRDLEDENVAVSEASSTGTSRWRGFFLSPLSKMDCVGQIANLPNTKG
jgi:hypothetical protein